ncbi:MAG: hypothetical protein QCI00_03260 [Candidatus Thermoplasmatota archaeon]|nr:hypothetical protein [Candidatus Thermoplasmatota archaeon]
MQYIDIELGSILTRSLIQFIINLSIGIILLHIATKLLGFKKRGFIKATGTILIGSILAFMLGFIPIIGQFAGLLGFWFIIKKIYDVGWIKAILAWLMSIFIAFIIASILTILLGLSNLFMA